MLDSFLPLTGGAGCQVSALGLPWKNRDAVLVSAPAWKDRTQGVLSLGFLEKGHQIRWAARRQLTEAGEEFAYSCLAALPNGKVGLLYETSNQPQAMDAVRFRELSLEEPGTGSAPYKQRAAGSTRQPFSFTPPTPAQRRGSTPASWSGARWGFPTGLRLYSARLPAPGR